MKKLTLITAVLFTSIISTALIADQVVINSKVPNDIFPWTSQDPAHIYRVINGDSQHSIDVKVQVFQTPIELNGVNISCNGTPVHMDAGARNFECKIDPGATMTITNDGVKPKLSSEGTVQLKLS